MQRGRTPGILAVDHGAHRSTAKPVSGLAVSQLHRQTRRDKPLVTYELGSLPKTNLLDSAPSSPLLSQLFDFEPAFLAAVEPQHNMAQAAAAPANSISGDGALLPPPFEGKASEDAENWLAYFVQYCTYKGIDGKPQQLELWKLLMRGQAHDYFASLPDDQKDTFAHMQAAFKRRYQQSELIKYRSAKDLFTRKQAITETVDDYVTLMRKMARKISETLDDDMVMYAILAGLQPQIASYVVAKAPKTTAELLDAARVAELTVQPAADTHWVEQLAEMQTEVKNLRKQLERCSTAVITSTSDRRSPTPERRRVSFQPRPSTPPTGATNNQTSSNYGNSSKSYYRKPYAQGSSQGSNSTCDRCGYATHRSPKDQCPALREGATCAFCRKPRHFAKVCRAALRNQQSQ